MPVDRIDVHGVWWRVVPHGGDPLFRPVPPADGRWQNGDVIEAMYFADEEDTAWAEWYRALAAFAIPPDHQMPRDLWRWQIDLDGVANLSQADALRDVGLTRPCPSRSEWPSFQSLGEKLWREGFRGVLAPSAARSSFKVLCLFREADEIVGADPIRPPTTYRRAPAPPTGMQT